MSIWDLQSDLEVNDHRDVLYDDAIQEVPGVEVEPEWLESQRDYHPGWYRFTGSGPGIRAGGPPRQNQTNGAGSSDVDQKIYRGGPMPGYLVEC